MLKSVPPSVDERDESTQTVFDWTVPMRYGDDPVEVQGRLLYTGGSAWWKQAPVLAEPDSTM